MISVRYQKNINCPRKHQILLFLSIQGKGALCPLKSTEYAEQPLLFLTIFSAAMVPRTYEKGPTAHAQCIQTDRSTFVAPWHHAIRCSRGAPPPPPPSPCCQGMEQEEEEEEGAGKN